MSSVIYKREQDVLSKVSQLNCILYVYNWAKTHSTVSQHMKDEDTRLGTAPRKEECWTKYDQLYKGERSGFNFTVCKI